MLKQRMEMKDVDLLNEKQKSELQILWKPKAGDFILNTSANNRNGYVFVNYYYQPYDDRPDWRLEVEYDDKRSFLIPMLNVLQMIDMMKDNGFDGTLKDVNWLDFDNLFDQVYPLFLNFLDEF